MAGNALKGNRDAQWQLACAFDNGSYGVKDLTQAMHFFLLAAKAGHAGAQQRVGYMYCKGEGCTADSKLAVEWTQKAAAQGEAYAHFNLGAVSFSSSLLFVCAHALNAQGFGMKTALMD